MSLGTDMVGTSSCERCGGLLRFVRKAEDEGGAWTPLDAVPVQPGHVDAREVRAVDGIVGWKIPALRERLEFAHADTPGDDAPGEVYDYPWHRVHRCDHTEPFLRDGDAS